jgi:hypothetical protein
MFETKIHELALAVADIEMQIHKVKTQLFSMCQQTTNKNYNGCIKKKAYYTAKAAGDAANSAKLNGSNDILRIYECPYCQKFHLTKMTSEEFINRL